MLQYRLAISSPYTAMKTDIDYDKEIVNIYLLLLFDTLPQIDPAQIERALAASGPTQPMAVRRQGEVEGYPLTTVEFNGHRLVMIAYNEPAPFEAIDLAISAAPWPETEKAPLRTHRAHIGLSYFGPSNDAIEQMECCMRVAGVFLDRGLLGYVDRVAWNCLPAATLRPLVQPKMAQVTSLEQIPLGVWTGFVKFPTGGDGVCFFTKGYHRWGMPDLAWHGLVSDSSDAFDMLSQVFVYVLESGLTLHAGLSLRLGGNMLHLILPAPDAGYLNSPLGTLLIEKAPSTLLN
jgi:hypothetical protein